MMTAGDVWPWIGTVVVGVALVVAAAIAWLALLRWLIVIVPAIVLVGFAFAPELQLRFTMTLFGVLAILYLPPLLMAWVWRQFARSRAVVPAGITPPSALEIAHQAFADKEARDRADQHSKAANDARDQDDRDSRARELERQGMVSLWSRQ
jgi:hypothetical protein